MERSGSDDVGVRASHLLFCVQLVVFLVLVIGTREASWYPRVLSIFGLSDAASLMAHPWTLLTYPLVNVYPLEFVVSAGVLLLVGLPVEERLGRARFLLIYGVSAGLTGLAHVVLYEGGMVDAPVFVGATGASAGLLTAYLFTLGHERRVGGVPFPVVYLLAACFLFMVLALVDHSDQQALQQKIAERQDLAYAETAREPVERREELLAVARLEGQRADLLGHLLGLATGGLALALSRGAFHVHRRYRVMREIRVLQEEVDARARVEQLLEQISRDGLESLSRHDRKFLRYASRFYSRRLTPPQA